MLSVLVNKVHVPPLSVLSQTPPPALPTSTSEGLVLGETTLVILPERAP
jgi:hypothetical protein